MQIKKINENLVQYHFEIPYVEFENFIKKAFDNIKTKVIIKGFRKGNIDQNIFERHYGFRILYKNAFEFLLKEKLDYILKYPHDNLSLIGEPKLINFQLEKINKNKPLHFGLEFELKPKVTLCSYKNIPISFANITVSEQEIQEQIDLLLKSKAPLKSKEPNSLLSQGDIAVFDFKGFLDKKPFPGGQANNYQLEIGSNKLVDGFEKGMIGMKVGERKNITLVFPTNYKQKNLAGKLVIFEVFLHEIKTRDKMILTDSLVNDMNLFNIKTINDLKIKITQDLTSRKTEIQKEQQIKEILDFLFKNTSSLKTPSYLVNLEFSLLKENFISQLSSMGMTLEQYCKNMEYNLEEWEKQNNEIAIRNVHLRLVLDEIVKKEKIFVSDKELDHECSKISIHYKISLTRLKQNKEFLQNINQKLLHSKVLDFLLNNALENKTQKISLSNNV
ncbi:MAG: trigger factor [Vigna little leaf phytoplasma]|nr:trigger factor [Vigna little leaf phytoplasma]